MQIAFVIFFPFWGDAFGCSHFTRIELFQLLPKSLKNIPLLHKTFKRQKKRIF
jgi:hypothetical protein